MPTYTEDDCLAAIQLAAWMIGEDASTLSAQAYRDTGMTPTVRTITKHFDSWVAAKEQAAEDIHHIPSHLPQYYRSVAALRRARDIIGHPVTGLRYRDLDIEVEYLEVLEPFRTWTQAKIVARVHTPGDEPWDGIEPIDP